MPPTPAFNNVDSVMKYYLHTSCLVTTVILLLIILSTLILTVQMMMGTISLLLLIISIIISIFSTIFLIHHIIIRSEPLHITLDTVNTILRQFDLTSAQSVVSSLRNLQRCQDSIRDSDGSINQTLQNQTQQFISSLNVGENKRDRVGTQFLLFLYFLENWYSSIGDSQGFITELGQNIFKLLSQASQHLEKIKLRTLLKSVCNTVHRELRKQDVYSGLKRPAPPEHPSLKNSSREKYLEMLLSHVLSNRMSITLPTTIALAYSRVNLENIVQKLTNNNQSLKNMKQIQSCSSNKLEESESGGSFNPRSISNVSQDSTTVENVLPNTSQVTLWNNNEQMELTEEINSQDKLIVIEVNDDENDFDDEISNHYHEGVADLGESIGRLRILLEQKKKAEESQNFTRSLSEPAQASQKAETVLRTFSLKDKHSSSNGDAHHQHSSLVNYLILFSLVKLKFSRRLV